MPDLVHAITTRQRDTGPGAHAAFNLGHGCGDDPEIVERNRERVREDLGLSRLLFLRQVHGAALTVVQAAELPAGAQTGDGWVTDRPGLALGVLGADCPGVLLVSTHPRALALVHAGWRGVVAGIVPATLDLLEAHYGIRPPELKVGIGPGISAARYEVSADVAELIASSIPTSAHDDAIFAGRPGHAHVDLRAALRAQLLAREVRVHGIEVHPACTWNDARFFSHRRDAGVTGRHALVAGWRA